MTYELFDKKRRWIIFTRFIITFVLFSIVILGWNIGYFFYNQWYFEQLVQKRQLILFREFESPLEYDRIRVNQNDVSEKEKFLREQFYIPSYHRGISHFQNYINDKSMPPVLLSALFSQFQEIDGICYIMICYGAEIPSVEGIEISFDDCKDSLIINDYYSKTMIKKTNSPLKSLQQYGYKHNVLFYLYQKDIEPFLSNIIYPNIFDPRDNLTRIDEKLLNKMKNKAKVRLVLSDKKYSDYIELWKSPTPSMLEFNSE